MGIIMLKEYGHIVIDISVLILFKNTVGEHVVQVFCYFLKNDYFFEEQDFAKIIVNEIVFFTHDSRIIQHSYQLKILERGDHIIRQDTMCIQYTRKEQNNYNTSKKKTRTELETLILRGLLLLVLANISFSQRRILPHDSH